MLHKIISKLPFNPSLVSELDPYITKLQRSRRIYRTCLALSALLVATQSVLYLQYRILQKDSVQAPQASQSGQIIKSTCNNCLQTSVQTTIYGGDVTDKNNPSINSGETLQYKFKLLNASKKDVSVEYFGTSLSGVLPFANIIDASGATISEDQITWPAQDIDANSKIQRTLLVKVKSPLPRIQTNTNSQQALVLVFGNTETVKLHSVLASTLTQRATSLAYSSSQPLAFWLSIITVLISAWMFKYTDIKLKQLLLIKSEFSGDTAHER